jgi:hypothetical protein
MSRAWYTESQESLLTHAYESLGSRWVYKSVKPLLFSSHLVQPAQVTFYIPYHTHTHTHTHTMKIDTLLLSALSAVALAGVSNSSSQGMQSTETATLFWEGPHSTALPGPTGF